MRLTNVECKQLKPQDKPYKKYDGAGLYLEVMPTGKKYWRYRYKFDGKEKRISFGPYPLISLKEARDKHANARKLVLEGIDPTVKRKQEEEERKVQEENTFENIAREWHGVKKNEWSEKYANTIIGRLETDVFPEIGSLPITEIKPHVLIEMLRKVEKRGVYETTRRIVQYCGQVLRYAVATGRAERDFTADIKYALKTRKVEHRAAITPQELPELVKAIEHNKSRMYEPTQLAVKFMLLTFVRTNELIKAKWDEFDFEERMWTIPAERMKMRKDHLVPLSTQALEVLERLKELHGQAEPSYTNFGPLAKGLPSIRSEHEDLSAWKQPMNGAKRTKTSFVRSKNSPP